MMYFRFHYFAKKNGAIPFVGDIRSVFYCCSMVVKLLGYHFELYGCLDVLVEFDCSLVLAHFLDVGFVEEGDLLAVNFDAFLGESLGDLDGVDRAEDFAGLACLGANLDFLLLDESGEFCCVLAELLLLVCLLLLVFGEHLLGGFCCRVLRLRCHPWIRGWQYLVSI